MCYLYSFNGQEKDDEIAGAGNINTAMFWEYDTRLGRRWNLDPKPDPSISSYASFANNPIWYTDILGDVVDYKTNSDKKNVEKYTNKTEIRRGFLGLGALKERRNKNYSSEFANIVKDLHSRTETYVFQENNNITNPKGNKIDGKFSYDGTNFNIEYSAGSPEFGGGLSGVLFEETFHAKQFTQGKFTFENHGNGFEPGQLDANDEVEAKRFAITAPGYRSTFNGSSGSASTQLGFIAKSRNAEAIKFLIYGGSDLMHKSNGGTVTNTYLPSYPGLSSNQQNSNLSEKTFNSNIVGYPFK